MRSPPQPEPVEKPMFKRMSILEMRPGDDQAFFSRHWEQTHGPLVARLPLIRSYVQNHVEARYEPNSFRAAGIVELHFDDAAAMDEAFASQASRAVRADEPDFLGHAAGYVIGDSVLRPAGDRGKLVVIMANEGAQSGSRQFEATLAALPGLVDLVRDDVTAMFTRPDAARSGQRVDSFFHLYFGDVAQARHAGPRIAALGGGSLRLGAFLVRTVPIVQPADRQAPADARI